MNKSQKFFCLSAVMVGTLLPGVASATTMYTVTVNTNAVTGQDGYLDLQFEPSPSPTNPAVVRVTGFSTDGTLTGAAVATGDVTGQLPATLTFDNQTAFNDYFQEMTFGTTETFIVSLDAPVPAGGAASAFNISFYAADQSTPLLTDSPDGEAGQIVLNGNGTTSVMVFPTAPGDQPALTITPMTVAVAPEPAQLGLIGLGLALFGAFRYRSRIAHKA